MVINLTNLPKPDVILVLNGVIDFDILLTYDLSEYQVIATDGAAIQLYSKEVVPSLIIGDLDSIPTHVLEALKKLTTVISVEDQETTDFEKALYHIRSLQNTNVLVFGFHGGDFDHSFNNVSILAKFSNDFIFQIADNHRICFLLDSYTRIENVIVGEIVSLVTYSEVLITTKGLFWALTNEYLRFGEREGARNKATFSTVELDISEGNLIACFDFKF